jgi:hypothetical protein
MERMAIDWRKLLRCMLVEIGPFRHSAATPDVRRFRTIVLQNPAAFWSCSGFEYWSVAVVSAEGRGPIVSSWPPGGRLRCTDDRR